MVCYLRDVVSQLELRDLQTAGLKKKLPMPGLGSVASYSGRRQDAQLFFNFTGFTEPGAIYKYTSLSPLAPHHSTHACMHARMQTHSLFN